MAFWEICVVYTGGLAKTDLNDDDHDDEYFHHTAHTDNENHNDNGNYRFGSSWCFVFSVCVTYILKSKEQTIVTHTNNEH